eukprot:8456848-Karenia_brevis.AAC.1
MCIRDRPLTLADLANHMLDKIKSTESELGNKIEIGLGKIMTSGFGTQDKRLERHVPLSERKGCDKLIKLMGESNYSEWSFKMLGFLTEAYPPLRKIIHSIDTGERDLDGQLKKEDKAIDEEYIQDLVDEDDFEKAPIVN